MQKIWLIQYINKYFRRFSLISMKENIVRTPNQYKSQISKLGDQYDYDYLVVINTHTFSEWEETFTRLWASNAHCSYLQKSYPSKFYSRDAVYLHKSNNLQNQAYVLSKIYLKTPTAYTSNLKYLEARVNRINRVCAVCGSSSNNWITSSTPTNYVFILIGFR